MHVYRGRAGDRSADREATAAMLDRAGDTGVPAVRAWSPHRQVAFGRRDVNEPGYADARLAAESRGFPAVERRVGGRAVAYTGRTVAFAYAVPVSDVRTGLDDRYDAAVDAVRRGLAALGVDAREGEPADSFCPGTHSLQRRGKLAGVAQRVRTDAALVAGCVVVDGHREIASVLDPVYRALGVPFDPDTVGSVVRAGGPDDPERVARAVEAAVRDGREATVERVESMLPGEKA